MSTHGRKVPEELLCMVAQIVVATINDQFSGKILECLCPDFTIFTTKYCRILQLEDELDFTKAWLHNHVSDHSAVNHRIQVIGRIMSNQASLEHILSAYSPALPTAPTTAPADPSDHPAHVTLPKGLSHCAQKVLLIGLMLEESEESLTSRPGQESLWCLRRLLLEVLLTALFANADMVPSNAILNGLDTVGAFGGRVPACVPEKHHGEGLFEKCTSLMQDGADQTTFIQKVLDWLGMFVQSELLFVERCCDENATAWNSAAQTMLARRYAHFLKERVATRGGLALDVENANEDATSVHGSNSY